jgi:hypothetical protein
MILKKQFVLPAFFRIVQGVTQIMICTHATPFINKS